MKQQLPIADRGMVFPIAVRILADVRIDQPSLISEYRGVGFLELDLPVFGGLYLSAGKDYAALETVHQEVVVASLAVVAEDLESGLFGHGTFISTRGTPIASI